MMDAFKTTIFCSVFIGISFFAVFQFIEYGTPLFFILLSLPIFLSIFALAFEWHATSLEKVKYFREMKRQEIEIEFLKEFSSWVPQEVKKKWYDDGSSAVELYKKKMELWKNP